MALFEVNSGPFWLDLVQFGSYLGPLQAHLRFNLPTTYLGHFSI